MMQELQAAGEVEAVGDAFIQSRADVDQGADLFASVGLKNFGVVVFSDRDHYAVGPVIVQMMVDRGAFDAAQVAAEDSGVVGVAVGEKLRVDAPEIQYSYDTDDHCEDRPRYCREGVQQRIDPACGVLALSYLLDIADDLSADGVEGIGIVRNKDHQRFFSLIAESALDDKTQTDLVALIQTVALDEAVHLGTFTYHTREGGYYAVENRRRVFGM